MVRCGEYGKVAIVPTAGHVWKDEVLELFTAFIINLD